jgi:hypothetical protein
VVFIGNRAVVSESGTGGPDCFVTFLSPNTCVGPTSQVSWVDTNTGAHTVLAGGFFSMSTGQESLGVSGLAVQGRKLYAQISVTSREVPSSIAIGQQAGDLIEINSNTGAWKTVANVGDFDFDFTKQFPPVSEDGTTGQEHDANPTGILESHGSIYVADSGANTITQVSPSGKMTIVQYFPQRYPNAFPSDEVPTCVAAAGDGLWVGTLAGNLFRVQGGVATPVVPKNSQGTPLLSHVTGCNTGPDGTLYLVNMFGPGIPFTDPSFFNGSVVAFHPKSGAATVLADTAAFPTLFLPYSATIGPDGNLYVVAGAICPASGEGLPLCTVGNVKGGRLLKIEL